MVMGGLLVAPRPALPPTDDQPPTLRIIGGAPAGPGVWPAMVRLSLARRTREGMRGALCGGTIIGRQWVLTAAHCTVDHDGNRAIAGQSFALEGTTDVGPGRGRRIAIAEVIPHPAYSGTGGTRNDIALLRLAEPSQQPRQKLLAAADRTTVLTPGRMVTVTGFGRTSASEQGPISDRLLQVDVPLVAMRQCAVDLTALRAPAASFGDFAICAGFREGGRDSCQGDSGGPLFAPTSTGTAQVGVVSWGLGCARARAPGVYASVGHFEAWIRSHVPDADFTSRASTAAASPGPAPGLSPAPAPPRPSDVTDTRCFAPFHPPPEVAPSQSAQLSIDIVEGNRPRIGTSVTFRIQSSVEGALVVFAVNPADQIVVLFPNPRAAGFMPGQATRRMTPGQTMLLPGPADGFRAVVQPPAGAGVVCAAILPVNSATRALIEQTPALTPLEDPSAFRTRLDHAVLAARQASPSGSMTPSALASRLYEVMP
jgi:hypothetical protein